MSGSSPSPHDPVCDPPSGDVSQPTGTPRSEDHLHTHSNSVSATLSTNDRLFGPRILRLQNRYTFPSSNKPSFSEHEHYEVDDLVNQYSTLPQQQRNDVITNPHEGRYFALRLSTSSLPASYEVQRRTAHNNGSNFASMQRFSSSDLMHRTHSSSPSAKKSWVTDAYSTPRSDFVAHHHTRPLTLPLNEWKAADTPRSETCATPSLWGILQSHNHGRMRSIDAWTHEAQSGEEDSTAGIIPASPKTFNPGCQPGQLNHSLSLSVVTALVDVRPKGASTEPTSSMMYDRPPVVPARAEAELNPVKAFRLSAAVPTVPNQSLTSKDVAIVADFCLLVALLRSTIRSTATSEPIQPSRVVIDLSISMLLAVLACLAFHLLRNQQLGSN